MSTNETVEKTMRKLVRDLEEALGGRLKSVLLYGSAARGDYQKKTSDINLLLVLEDLTPATLEAAAPVLGRWSRRGQPLPRLFSPAGIRDSADVFPIELLDIQKHRVLLHGADPLEGLEIHTDHLRLQCERELREKMMRLREGFIEAVGSSRALRTLLTESYTSFLALFRGCLHLLGGEVPVHNEEVVKAFCARAEIDPAPFAEVDRLKRGEKVESDLKALFARYYERLTEAVHRVDRFEPPAVMRQF